MDSRESATAARVQRHGPLDQSQMRAANTGLILRQLRTHGARSRARLASETGLSRATVTSLVADLVERGLVRQGEIQRVGSVGRPGTSIALNSGRVGAIGAQITVDHLALSIVDLTGEVVEEHIDAVAVDHMSPREAIDILADHIDHALASMRARGLFACSMTVSPPGVIDYASGSVRFAPNLGWRDIALIPGLRHRLGPQAPPIHLENDAKLAALAEYVVHAPTGVDDLLFLTGDTGVGAGIIANGQLVRGWQGFSGEVGHLPLNPTGGQCKCGRTGCWETGIGLMTFLARCAPSGGDLLNPALPLEERLHAITDRARAGDPTILAALESITSLLASGLSILNDMLNPQVIVLGGYLTFLGEFILAPLAAELERRRMSGGGIVTLTLARLGMNSTARGGALMALDDVFADPTLVGT